MTTLTARSPVGERSDSDPMGIGFTKMQTAAVQMHETVTAMVDAGFTRAEAVYFMAVFVSKSPGTPPVGGKNG